ncbi:hypothetical protein V502_04821 [Pseudogymnoascus sp. VKM F-4520 (FW-2644)]|nr:hypothetical protein V502_04821 [Pseudogymnoascus sp. VKM F-4520 (FW-2644)]
MSFSQRSLRGQSRGSWRGGADRGGRGRAWYPKPLPTAPSGPKGPEIDSIDIKVLLIEEDAPEITNVEYIASYNWLDSAKPTVLVPGSPPAWTPPAEDFQLKQDEGDVFRDINAAHYPSYPVEPAMRSVIALQPDFDLHSVDLVGCGSTIGNLLRFAGSQTKPFRFDVDVVGDTIFFVRRENSPTELIKDVRGYGHTFPEGYTTWNSDSRRSVSHQRIIRYEFGGLRFLVRTETDGYLKDAGDKTINSLASQDPLEDSIGNVSMSSSSPSATEKLQLKMQGREVSQEQIFDIKTRAQQNIFNMEEILPRLWLNQTSKFLLAYHRYGLFDQPKVEDVRQLVISWQKDNLALLSRFHAILRRIVDVVRDSDEQQLEVSWDGQGPLLITKQVGKGRRALPSDLRELWDDAPDLESS